MGCGRWGASFPDDAISTMKHLGDDTVASYPDDAATLSFTDVSRCVAAPADGLLPAIFRATSCSPARVLDTTTAIPCVNHN